MDGKAESPPSKPKPPTPGFWTRLSFTLRLRRLSAILGPVMFSLRTGHLLSALGGKPVDEWGKPVPWYTYPTIRFLSQHDFSGADVLEFGGGQSTLWWAKRASTVVCLDPHARWADWLRKRVPNQVSVHHLSKTADTSRLLENLTFDVIIVDAGSEEEPFLGRIANMRTAVTKLRPGGLLVVDNTTPPWAKPISEIAAAEGFARIDFIGFAPGGVTEYGTSLYFKEVPQVLLNGRAPLSPKQMAQNTRR